MTNMSKFSAETSVGDEFRDSLPDTTGAKGKPEDIDGLIAIIAAKGEDKADIRGESRA